MAVRFAGELSPAYARLGGRLEVQPLAIVRLHAQYQYVQTFGLFQSAASFEEPTADYSDEELKDRDKDYVTGGGLLEIGALLQAKVGPIAIRNNTVSQRFNMVLRADDWYLYDRTLDTLMENGGWSLTNETDLLYVTNFGLTAGLRYTHTNAFYTSADKDPEKLPHDRVGPAVLYRFGEKKPGAMYQPPMVFLLAQWWLRHPYRTGQKSAQGLPLTAVGIIQEGDFLP